MSLNAGPESKVLNPTEQWPEGIGKACIPLISWTLARLWPLRSFLSLSPCFSASLIATFAATEAFECLLGTECTYCISFILEGHSYETINQGVLMIAQLNTGT